MQNRAKIRFLSLHQNDGRLFYSQKIKGAMAERLRSAQHPNAGQNIQHQLSVKDPKLKPEPFALFIDHLSMLRVSLVFHTIVPLIDLNNVN